MSYGPRSGDGLSCAGGLLQFDDPGMHGGAGRIEANRLLFDVLSKYRVERTLERLEGRLPDYEGCRNDGATPCRP